MPQNTETCPHGKPNHKTCRLYVSMYKAKHKPENDGGGITDSESSELRCTDCFDKMRTAAKFVETLPRQDEKKPYTDAVWKDILGDKYNDTTDTGLNNQDFLAQQQFVQDVIMHLEQIIGRKPCVPKSSIGFYKKAIGPLNEARWIASRLNEYENDPWKDK